MGKVYEHFSLVSFLLMDGISSGCQWLDCLQIKRMQGNEADKSNQSDCFRLTQIRVRDDAVWGLSVISQVKLNSKEQEVICFLSSRLLRCAGLWQQATEGSTNTWWENSGILQEGLLLRKRLVGKRSGAILNLCWYFYLIRSEIKLKHATPTRVDLRLGEQLDILHTTRDLQGPPSAGEK